jgi:hypothetical protein
MQKAILDSLWTYTHILSASTTAATGMHMRGRFPTPIRTYTFSPTITRLCISNNRKLFLKSHTETNPVSHRITLDISFINNFPGELYHAQRIY